MASAFDREYVYLIRRARKAGDWKLAEELHDSAILHDVEIDKLLEESDG